MLSPFFLGHSWKWPHLLLGDLEHAETLIFLQKFIFGPNLLPEAVQLLLLLLRAQVDARHSADDLSHLLELGFEGIQVLVDVWAVLVHAAGDKRAVIRIHRKRQPLASFFCTSQNLLSSYILIECLDFCLSSY